MVTCRNPSEKDKRMTGESSTQIVRYTERDTAATGEGARYECADGSTWKDAWPCGRVDGYQVNGYIVSKRANR